MRRHCAVLSVRLLANTACGHCRAPETVSRRIGILEVHHEVEVWKE